MVSTGIGYPLSTMISAEERLQMFLSFRHFGNYNRANDACVESIMIIQIHDTITLVPLTTYNLSIQSKLLTPENIS